MSCLLGVYLHAHITSFSPFLSSLFRRVGSHVMVAVLVAILTSSSSFPTQLQLEKAKDGRQEEVTQHSRNFLTTLLHEVACFVLLREMDLVLISFLLCIFSSISPHHLQITTQNIRYPTHSLYLSIYYPTSLPQPVDHHQSFQHIFHTSSTSLLSSTLSFHASNKPPFLAYFPSELPSSCFVLKTNVPVEVRKNPPLVTVTPAQS